MISGKTSTSSTDGSVSTVRVSIDIPRYPKTATPTAYHMDAERPSEEQRGLLRNTSIDTTCASSDPTGRTSTTVPPGPVLDTLRRSQASASFSQDEEPSEAEWTATIVDSFDLCGAVRYILQVRMPPRKWLIRRRYNDFIALHEALRARFGEAGLPSVPPKSFSLFGPSVEFLEARERALQRYIDMISASRAPLRNCSILRRFLAPPRPEDRHTFLSSGVPPLPTDLPDLPLDAAWPADVGADAKAAIEAAVAEGGAALRRLYVFEQTLETDSSPERQSICFDQERAHVADALRTLAEFAPRLTALCAGPEAPPALRAWKELALFVNECGRVVGQAVAWGSAFGVEEALAIKRVLGNMNALVRPVTYYERRAETVLREWAAVGRDHDCWAAPPHSVAELLDQIVHEMELRSNAHQAVSVARLRRLHTALKDGHTFLTSERALQTPPFRGIADALTKRTDDVAHALASLLAHETDDAAADVPDAEAAALDLTGTAYSIDQLDSDIAAAREALAALDADDAARQGDLTGVADQLARLQQRVAHLRETLHAPPGVELPSLSV